MAARNKALSCEYRTAWGNLHMRTHTGDKPFAFSPPWSQGFDSRVWEAFKEWCSSVLAGGRCGIQGRAAHDDWAHVHAVNQGCDETESHLHTWEPWRKARRAATGGRSVSNHSAALRCGRASPLVAHLNLALPKASSRSSGTITGSSKYKANEKIRADRFVISKYMLVLRVQSTGTAA